MSDLLPVFQTFFHEKAPEITTSLRENSLNFFVKFANLLPGCEKAEVITAIPFAMFRSTVIKCSRFRAESGLTLSVTQSSAIALFRIKTKTFQVQSRIGTE